MIYNTMSLNKSNLSLIILILVAIISGCSSNINNFNGVSNTNFRSGTDGITLLINGPSKITAYGDEEATFPETYTLKIENKGASDVDSSGFFAVLNLQNRLEFTTSSNQNSNTFKSLTLESFSAPKILAGKSKYSKKGDLGQFDFTLRGYPPKMQGIEAKMSAEVCYKYETILEDSICINLRRQNKKTGCSKEIYSYSGQGAPIRISQIDVIPVNDTQNDMLKQVFIITIENVGGELFSLPESFKESCTSKKDLNKLRIKAMLGTEELECLQANNGIIELKENKKEFRCEAKKIDATDPSGYYTAPLRIQLSYGYHEYLDKKIDITRDSYIK